MSLARALEGVLVVDLARQYPGPFAAQILRDLGARVVKVEDPGGDFARWVDPQVDRAGYIYAATNRGKENVAVDLRAPEGADVVRRLAARADVLVESFRPGLLVRMGLAPEALVAVNPRLVVASLSGWGAEGPLRDAPGHDVNYQSLAGVLGVAGAPQLPGAQLADVAGALYATIAILAQLRTGRGAHLDLALADAALAANLLHTARAAAGDAPAPGRSELAGGLPGYNLYETSDGRWIALGALEPKFWERFLSAADAPQLAEFGLGLADPAARDATAKVVAGRTLADWDAILTSADVPWSPVLRPEEAVVHPQFASRGRGPSPSSPLGLGPTGKVPRVGEHTDAILAELGYSDSEVASMRRRGAVA